MTAADVISIIDHIARWVIAIGFVMFMLGIFGE